MECARTDQRGFSLDHSISLARHDRNRPANLPVLLRATRR
jgi:hypothetical protein